MVGFDLAGGAGGVAPKACGFSPKVFSARGKALTLMDVKVNVREAGL